jgi:antitoxin MazE
VCLPAAIAREARLHDNQAVELKLVADGVLIRPVQPRLSLAERLASYTPMEGEATEAMALDPIGTEVIESPRRGPQLLVLSTAPFHRIPAQASSSSASTAATSPSLR